MMNGKTDYKFLYETLLAVKGDLGEQHKLLGAEIKRLIAQRDQLQKVCAEAYQFAGAYDAPVEVLDNLHAAANGLPIPHESFLPVDDSELVKQRDQLLEALDSLITVADNGCADAWRPEWDVARSAIAAVKGE